MERLKATELARLRVDAASFASSNHLRYLSEALQCMRRTGDPVEALVLLGAMWGTAYARRPDEKKALDDVGHWFERRLYWDPGAGAERVALELAWMRRLTRIGEAEAEREPRASRDRNRQEEVKRGRANATDRPRDEPRFGKLIESIRRRRAEIERRRGEESDARGVSPASGDATTPVAGAAPAPEPTPTQLPAVFEAEFVDFTSAHEAYRSAREREKRKKAPKERFLALRPVDVRLRPLAAGLVCSTALVGFKAIFSASASHGVAPRSFYVSGVEERGGQRVVGEILLEAPRVDESS
ncbi:hypothetical protein [Sorangium sp. So ce388]|uniref:hypothetical protein n=1 Tax=Sorangium sp. So ce388 TaxID=3133309 RepID=UPI003F5B487E